MFLNMHNKNNNYYCYYNNKQWLCISCMLCVTVSHCRGWKDIVSWCSSASTHVCFWSLLCTSLQPCIHWCGILTRSRQTELAKRGRHVLVTCSHHRLTSVTGSDWLSTDCWHFLQCCLFICTIFAIIDIPCIAYIVYLILLLLLLFYQGCWSNVVACSISHSLIHSVCEHDDSRSR